jgi:hypothetical protein
MERIFKHLLGALQLGGGLLRLPATTGPALPNPADLGAAYYWRFWDGDSISGLTDGGTFVTATDLVAGVQLIPTAAGKEPTWRTQILGGRDAVEFNGAQFLKTAANITLGAFTVFMVAQVSPVTTVSLIYEFTPIGTTTSGFYLNAYTSGVMVAKNTGGQSGRSTGTAWWAKSTPQATIQRMAGTDASHELHVNGSLRTLSPLGGYGTDPGTAAIADKFFLGGRNGASLPIDGYLSEIALFNGAISDGVLAELHAYTEDNYDMGY